MELNEFPYFSHDLINLKSEENLKNLNINQAVELIEYNDEWLLQQGVERIAVTCTKLDRPLFTTLVSRDQTQWMLAQKQNKTLPLQYLAPVEMTNLDIELGIDGLVSDDLFTKNEIPENTIELACGWISEHFVTNFNNIDNSEENQQNWLTISRFSNSSFDSTGNGFQLLGSGWRADIEAERDGRYLIKRIARHNRRDASFSLLVGSFTFTDASSAAVLQSPTHMAILEAALRDNGSYLELWNLYNDKEWAGALKQAETLKALRFSHIEAFENGRVNCWKIWPKSEEAYQEFRNRWKSLEIPKDSQVDLTTETPDWAEELGVEPKSDEKQQNSRGDIRFEQDHLVFTPSSNHRDAVPSFEGKDNKDPGGWLFLSLAGQRTMSKRRLIAREGIGKQMPQLKWLMEGVSFPSERRRKIKGLTPYAKETFKGGKPTAKQELAIETALNTPDLAIIIGPPGTGKTQVIAALQRRLAEEFEAQNISGQVLVSSFQHDAVDNALERSQVFNIPATRVGGKKSSAEDEGVFSRWVDKHTAFLKEQVDQQYQNTPMLQRLDEVSLTLALLRVSQLSAQQYVEQLQRLLKQLDELERSGARLSARLLSDLEDYVEEQQNFIPKSESIESNLKILRCIRGLRIDELSFSDDGQYRADDLRRELNRNLHTYSLNSEELLSQVIATPSPSIELLQQLLKLKDQLLDQYIPDYRPPELKQSLNQQGKDLLDRLDKNLYQFMSQHKQGVAWALQELATSIETDRHAALSTTEDYAMVVGATCQQSASNKMASLKSVSSLDSSGIVFDTVIIDEAARANPLDLFIPMSMAKRRIILVGDDRQLPHMLEPDIEGTLQEEHQLTEQHLEAFRSSLFERLRLQMEGLDDYQRVVMLDTQFRMHPILGDFVSQQFYESAIKGKTMEKIKSGRPEEEFLFEPDFIDALGDSGKYYQNKVCQWIDVPLSEGKSGKRGTSKLREAEADRIAKEVQHLLQAAGSSLSIGVITFYAAQRDLIMEKLANTKVNGIPLMIWRDGDLVPSEEFATTIDGEEGLRVGSVDAFQGKEFDVVLLSCVRTFYQPKDKDKELSKKPKSDEEFKLEHEDKLNKLFGFLRLPNRMNVGMSRQKRMLICVGDMKLATNDYADEGIPALKALHQLCGGEHGCIR